MTSTETGRGMTMVLGSFVVTSVDGASLIVFRLV
jgi:hypothetical protein